MKVELVPIDFAVAALTETPVISLKSVMLYTYDVASEALVVICAFASYMVYVTLQLLPK